MLQCMNKSKSTSRGTIDHMQNTSIMHVHAKLTRVVGPHTHARPPAPPACTHARTHTNTHTHKYIHRTTVSQCTHSGSDLLLEVEEVVALVDEEQFQCTPTQVVATEVNLPQLRQRPLEVFSTSCGGELRVYQIQHCSQG